MIGNSMIEIIYLLLVICFILFGLGGIVFWLINKTFNPEYYEYLKEKRKERRRKEKEAQHEQKS